MKRIFLSGLKRLAVNGTGLGPKAALVIAVCLMWLCGTALAGSSGYGLSLGYGESRDNIDIYRIGLQKEFPGKWFGEKPGWFSSRTGYLAGYFELSYNRWEGDDDETNGVALSPVFAYYLNTGNPGIRPYIEGGIGVAYIDEYRISGRNLASNFQFEDRIGAGVRIHDFDLNFRYMHYSNASLEDPNDGIDIWIGTLAWFF